MSSTQGEKTCSKCGQTKTLDRFTQRRSGKRAGEYFAACKNCSNKKVGHIWEEDNTGEEIRKCCSRCGCEWPATPEFFDRSSKTESGLAPACKECIRAYRQRPETKERHRLQEHARNQRPEVQEQKYHYNRRPEVMERRRRYKLQSEVQEKRRAYDRRPDVRKLNRIRCLTYYHRPDVNKRMRARHRAYMHRPEIRAINSAQKYARYQIPEVRAHVRAQWYARYHNPETGERMLAWSRAYRRRPEVQERLREQKRLAYRRDPRKRAQAKLARMRRRARLNSVPGSLTTEQIQYKLRKQKCSCYYCFIKFKKKKNGEYIYHLDHTAPISRPETGPRHDMSHTVLACPPCNLKKHNKTPHEFFEGGRLL